MTVYLTTIIRAQTNPVSGTPSSITADQILHIRDTAKKHDLPAIQAIIAYNGNGERIIGDAVAGTQSPLFNELNLALVTERNKIEFGLDGKGRDQHPLDFEHLMAAIADDLPARQNEKLQHIAIVANAENGASIIRGTYAATGTQLQPLADGDAYTVAAENWGDFLRHQENIQLVIRPEEYRPTNKPIAGGSYIGGGGGGGAASSFTPQREDSSGVVQGHGITNTQNAAVIVAPSEETQPAIVPAPVSESRIREDIQNNEAARIERDVRQSEQNAAARDRRELDDKRVESEYRRTQLETTRRELDDLRRERESPQSAQTVPLAAEGVPAYSTYEGGTETARGPYQPAYISGKNENGVLETELYPYDDRALDSNPVGARPPGLVIPVATGADYDQEAPGIVGPPLAAPPPNYALVDASPAAPFVSPTEYAAHLSSNPNPLIVGPSNYAPDTYELLPPPVETPLPPDIARQQQRTAEEIIVSASPAERAGIVERYIDDPGINASRIETRVTERVVEKPVQSDVNFIPSAPLSTDVPRGAREIPPEKNRGDEGETGTSRPENRTEPLNQFASTSNGWHEIRDIIDTPSAEISRHDLSRLMQTPDWNENQWHQILSERITSQGLNVHQPTVQEVRVAMRGEMKLPSPTAQAVQDIMRERHLMSLNAHETVALAAEHGDEKTR